MHSQKGKPVRVFFAFAVLAFVALFAHAQTTSGCGNLAITKGGISDPSKLASEANCAGNTPTAAETAEALRLEQIKMLKEKEPVLPPVPTPLPVPASTAQIGINASAGNYYSYERIWANLAYRGSEWFAREPADTFRADGYPNRGGRIFLNIPQAVFTGAPTRVTCTWKGAGKIFMDGDRVEQSYGDHVASVVWQRRSPEIPGGIFINFSEGNRSDPFRDLDCREAGVVQNGVFDQRFVDDMRPYRVIRYLDWSVANANTPVTWATRSLPDGAPGSDGVPIEHQVDLANLTGADVWFTIPWNADEDYVRRFATLVRDRLAPSRRAYFEAGNEVWNFGFPVATQALNEGVAESLDPDKYSNNLMRYAEKSIWMHKILSDVFKANPSRLVRVLGIQSGNTWALDKMMGFRDLRTSLDAVAIAPYFGHDMLRDATATTASLSARFLTLEASRVVANDQAIRTKAAVAKYRLRTIVYESGQHIVPNDANAPAAAEMQRSPLMGQAYDRYYADMKSILGDTIMVYSATGPISKYGAWGIREYAGQPISDTPKRRAVLDAGR
ncbi:hypothetical protein U1738_10895 [Sphingomonas sp. GB1N7]